MSRTMAKKQPVLNPTSVSGAAPARAPQPAISRTRAGKHSKAAPVPEKAAMLSEVSGTDFAIEVPTEVLAVEQVVARVSPTITTNNPVETIARLAYGYWEARGCAGGDPLEDWVRAEEEYRRLNAA